MRFFGRFLNAKMLAVLLALVLVASLSPGRAAAISGNTYYIYSSSDLNNIRSVMGPNNTYELMNDVDLSVYSTDTNGGSWTGWDPIGDGSSPFEGTFEGNGHTISNLYIYINGSALQYAGLFGYIDSDAVVDSVYLQGVSVSHGVSADNGGLVGYNSGGSITDCYATGSVSGNSAENGGLVGQNGNNGSITGCYATGSVSGSSAENGGLVGDNSGSITDSYATGGVSGGACNGGLVGWNSGPITDSYWDTTTTGQASSAGGGSVGGTGELDSAMKQENTFTSWDFTNTWGIDGGYTYPYLLGVTAASAICPTQATFDLNVSDAVYNADIPVNVTLNGNTLLDVRNVNTPLENTEYTTSVSGAVYTVTISQSYLDNLSVGTTTLTFDFNSGAPATLAVTVESLSTITASAITGATPPVTGATPVTSVADNGQYTAAVDWSPAVTGTFAAGTTYTATITITPDTDYTLAGVSSNFFTVYGTTSVTNDANSGVVTAVFPATAASISNNNGGGGAQPVLTPTVQTEAATSVTATSAVLSGDITSDNNYDVTDYGFLWGASSGSLANKLDVGANNQSGAFTDTLNGLTAGTTYYFEAYATNSQGTADGAVLSFATAGTAPATPTTSTPTAFSDVPSSYWGYAAIESLCSQGIISGYPDGTFKPESDITRAEFATMLVKVLDLSTAGANGAFTDVTPDDWCYGYVNAAASANLVYGIGDNLFAPNTLVTREQMAVMIAKALGNKAPAVNGTELDAFSDKADVSGWAITGMEEAVKAGTVSGMTPTTLAPLDNATRAEAAAMIYKLLGFLGR